MLQCSAAGSTAWSTPCLFCRTHQLKNRLLFFIAWQVGSFKSDVFPAPLGSYRFNENQAWVEMNRKQMTAPPFVFAELTRSCAGQNANHSAALPLHPAASPSANLAAPRVDLQQAADRCNPGNASFAKPEQDREGSTALQPKAHALLAVDGRADSVRMQRVPSCESELGRSRGWLQNTERFRKQTKAPCCSLLTAGCLL